MAFFKQALFVLAVVATAQALTAARAGAWAGGFGNANGLNLPQPPALPIFGQLNLPGFGNFHLPTPEEIASQVANAKPGANGQYTGIVASSIHGVTTDKDGNVVHTGGSSILTNDNGEVKEYEVGDNPPVIRNVLLKQQQQQQNPKSEKSEDEEENDGIYDPFNIFKNDPFFKPSKLKPKFQPIIWKPIVFEPIKAINPDEIRNYKPGANEQYVSHYTSSHSESSDVDGVKKHNGKVESIVNINGEVKEDSIVYDSDSDKQKKEQAKKEEQNE